MKFYFSAEYSVGVDKIGFLLNKILYKIESKLGDKEYGEEIVGITAIPIIVSDEFSNIPERKYVSWKNKESDVRLKIDYESFIKLVGMPDEYYSISQVNELVQNCIIKMPKEEKIHSYSVFETDCRCMYLYADGKTYNINICWI